jgi:hypothetical protein
MKQTGKDIHVHGVNFRGSRGRPGGNPPFLVGWGRGCKIHFIVISQKNWGGVPIWPGRGRNLSGGTPIPPIDMYAGGGETG